MGTMKNVVLATDRQLRDPQDGVSAFNGGLFHQCSCCCRDVTVVRTAFSRRPPH